jgi:hypothetical protein
MENIIFHPVCEQINNPSYGQFRLIGFKLKMVPNLFMKFMFIFLISKFCV